MRPVLTIFLIMLLIVIVLLFVIVIVPADKEDLSKVLDEKTLDNGTEVTNPIDLPSVPEVVVVEKINCEENFSCFLDNLSTCNENVLYSQKDNFSYPGNGTNYSFSLEYSILGFNQLSECEVNLRLVDHKTIFLDSEKSKYLENNYTVDGVKELEELLNSSILHLISKEGLCKLDVSSLSPLLTSKSFLGNLMENYQSCSGELFAIPEDPLNAQFFIYAN